MSKATTTSPSVNSRGEDARNYIPALRYGAQVMSASIGALWLSGTIVSGKTTRLLVHNAGIKPKHISITTLATLAQAISATQIDIALAAASAATISGFYVIGNQPTNSAVKYAAYLQF